MARTRIAPSYEEHPLRRRLVEEHGLKLWEITKALGGNVSEGLISSTLRGCQRMKPALEARLEALADQLDKEAAGRAA